MQPSTPTPSRKPLIIGGIIIVLAAAGALTYFLSTQSLTVSYDTGLVSEAKLYRAAADGTTITNGKAVKTLSSGQSYRVGRGSYVIEASGDKITTEPVSITVGSQAVKQQLSPNYSENYLRQKLIIEQPQITAAINVVNPQILKLYKIGLARLYGQGDWYGATLTYIGTDKTSSDSLRLVAQREGSGWTIATNPPQLVLLTRDYPQIPRSILSLVNALDPGAPR